MPFDDQKDPKRAIAGMEKMAQDGIHYVVGPNVDDGAAAVRPVAEQNGIMYFPYAFPKELYTAPASNADPGHGGELPVGSGDLQIPDGREGREEGCLHRRQRISDPLSQRDLGAAAARELGLEVVSDTVTYQMDTTDFTPVLLPVIQTAPDSARALRRLACQRAAADPLGARTGLHWPASQPKPRRTPRFWQEGAGELANGFISVGGASTAELASDTMKEFVTRYTEMFGEYNDEFEHQGLRAGIHHRDAEGEPGGDRQCGRVQDHDGHVQRAKPVHGGAKLTYVGTSSFGQKRQVSVPLVVNEYKDGAFVTLFVAQVD